MRTTLLVVASCLGLGSAFSADHPFGSGKGCTAVPKDQCGTGTDNSCLKCGTASAYDCEECCPGCTQIVKAPYKYCECKPGPGPSPTPPGGDTWANYEVAGMQVQSVVGGSDATAYSKAVIMLHGGGETGAMWPSFYSQGWFGNLTGLKYVFPTSPSHLWYISFKNGCGLLDDCAYNLSSITESAGRVAALIDHERQLLGGDGSKIYLAGFSQGAQMTGYVQLCQLDFALGGTVVMDGFPLPPLENMPGAPPAAAKANASYYGSDMRWMIWHGDADPIFPVNMTMNTWDGIFAALDATSTLKIEHTEPGMTHTVIEKEFTQLVEFVRAGP